MRKPKRVTTRLLEVRKAGSSHQVVTLVGGGHGYRKKPCNSCPWRVDCVGEFPAEAFRHSASTAYDMARNTFACHESGQSKPATCAGFLLKGANHNMTIRLGYIRGSIRQDVSAGGYELFENYRAMAEANGVDPRDPVLAPCRD